MIEMLGVLAIIGVLSAGGIWGYNQAMEAFTFNKFVKDVQTMHANAMQLFPKGYQGSRQLDWSGATLYRLGVLPNDLYKTASGRYVKNPFTGKIDWVIRLQASYVNDYTYKSNLGLATVTGNWVLIQNYMTVPKKICVKMLTFNWGSFASYYMITLLFGGSESTFKRFVSPVTVSEAEKACVENTYLSFIFPFYSSFTPQWQ